MNLYNEIAPFPAEWLRRLIAAGEISDGAVLEQSIVDLQPEDVVDATRAHFFAGLGGWDLALRLAGWPAGTPVWTGSCPCQPFSIAGKRRGFEDERHLWPEWRRLIEECRPPAVFGEQAASPDGRAWLATVRHDLEALGYAVGAADLPACGVGAPHIRRRLWFVAYSDSAGLAQLQGKPSDVGPARRTALERDSGPTRGAWGDAEWLSCRDGLWRPTQPGIRPLADGIPGRVGRIRALGNAIVPQVAAEFVAASMSALLEVA